MTTGPHGDLPEIPGHIVRRELGKGSMGVVYEAERIQDGLKVALKILPPLPNLSERSLTRFQREGRILRRIQHPGLLRVYEQGQTGNLHWFTMELVRGTNLAERLQAGPLPVRQAARLGIAAARALDAAHNHGVVHRDLKPGNILLRDPEGPGSAGSGPGDVDAPGDHLRIAIGDFGLARDIDTGSVTESGALVGTPIYMAPEVILGHTAGEVPATLTDIYGLGATLYHAVTGHPPYAGPTAQSVLRAVVERAPPNPMGLRRDLPVPFAAILSKAMAQRPADRYGAAEELAEDLERMLAGTRVLAKLPGPGVRLWRLARRRPMASGLLVVILALAFGSLSLLDAQRRESMRRELIEAESLLLQADNAVDGTGQATSAANRVKSLERAEFLVTNSLAQQPDQWEPWLLRARIRLRMQRPADALGDVAKALDLDGVNRVTARLLRIQILEQVPGAEARAQLQYELQRLLAEDDSSATRCAVAEHLLRLARSAMPGQEQDTARDQVDKLLQAVPRENPQAAVLRARLLDQRGERSKALELLADAWLLHPNHLGLAAEEARILRSLPTAGEPSPPSAANQATTTAPSEIQGVGEFLQEIDQLLEGLPAGETGKKEGG